MDENNNNNNQLGEMNIADEVYAITAGNATIETEGVAAMSGGFTGGIAKILGRKNITKGVKVDKSEEGITVDLNLIVKYEVRIPEVTEKVQKKVKEALETVTGAKVLAVNVNVLGIDMPDMEEDEEVDFTEEKKEDEEEEDENNN